MFKDRLGLKVCSDPLVLKAFRDPLERQAFKARRVFSDQQARQFLDLRARLDFKVLPELLARKVSKELPAFRVLPVWKGQQE